VKSALFLALKELLHEWGKAALIVLAVASGVALYIATDAMFAGWGDQLLDTVTDVWTSHLKVEPADNEPYLDDVARRLEAVHGLDGVVAAAPRITSPGLVRTEERRDSQDKGKEASALVICIDPEQEREVSTMADKVHQGEFLSPASSVPEVVLGVDLAEQVGAEVGDWVTLIAPGGRMTDYRVRGLLASGYYDYDRLFVITTDPERLGLPDLADRASELAVIIDRPRRAGDMAAPVAEAADVDRDQVSPWQELNRAVLVMLRVESLGALLAIAVLVAAAALTMANLMVLKVRHRVRYIGVLRAMGTGRPTIMGVYLAQAGLIGATGGLLGTLLGWLTVWYLKAYPLVIESARAIYGTAEFPVAYHPVAYVLGPAAAVLICIAAALWPARQATTLDPLEAIRNVY